MSQFLEDFTAFVREKGINVYRVSEMVGQQAPETVTLVPCNACQNSYSVAKVFVVSAIGLLRAEGRISLEETVPDVLGKLFPTDAEPRWRSVTVRMLLRHYCGLPGGFLDIDSEDSTAFGEDYLHYTLTEPMLRDPQVASVYTDAAYYLLSRMAEIRAGETLDNYLWPRLFAMLGFREMAWSRCPKGHTMGATGLYIYTEDMVKLGAIYRDGGTWQGKRILPVDWVAEVLREGYELRPRGIGRTFGKGGMHGQMLMVVPECDRAVAWHGYVRGGVKELVDWVAKYR